MSNGTYGDVRGRKRKVGRTLFRFSSYLIDWINVANEDKMKPYCKMKKLSRNKISFRLCKKLII